jgi:hypothetical protein
MYCRHRRHLYYGCQFWNTICSPPPQLSLHTRAALSSNSNGTRSVYNRKNKKQSILWDVYGLNPGLAPTFSMANSHWPGQNIRPQFLQTFLCRCPFKGSFIHEAKEFPSLSWPLEDYRQGVVLIPPIKTRLKGIVSWDLGVLFAI